MRARRDIAKQWERETDRDYLYAGSGKGSTVAAWKQAARAELAAANGSRYAQVLLDLVKAFERIPYRVLVREAKRLGYPLRLLRLAIATYKLPRVVRVGIAHSDLVWATRGIVAGSGNATSEMRLVMIDIVDSVMKRHPTIIPPSSSTTCRSSWKALTTTSSSTSSASPPRRSRGSPTTAWKSLRRNPSCRPPTLRWQINSWRSSSRRVSSTRRG